MTDSPNWDDIFADSTAPQRVGDRPSQSGTQAHPAAGQRMPAAAQRQAAVRSPLDEAELSLRESRVLGTPAAAGGGPAGPAGASTGPKRRGSLPWLLAMISVLTVGAVALVSGWAMYEDQIRALLGQEIPDDYAGAGVGEVTVVIEPGDIGADVTNTLLDAGVIKSFDAFYGLLLAQDPQVDFVPGSFLLKEQMSAQAALDALIDPENRITNRLAIREGMTSNDILLTISETLGVPLEEVEAVAADYEALGVPSAAPNIEGYLFPATYTLEPDATPESVLQLMVDEMMEALDEAGVAAADRHEIVTIASLIEREAGTEEDFYKVSRVIQNRLEEGMPLQFDSTAHYGAESQGSVWTTERERQDDNPYNTYLHPGLPIGPIAAPGKTALDAALNPADGDWLFFVAVNLRTGESAFSRTLAEHNRAIDQLDDWCRASDENAEYCR